MKQTTKLIKVKTPLLRKDTASQIRCKKNWTVVKEITNKAKQSSKSSFPWKTKTDNKIKTDADEIANQFNKYFEDTGPP